MILLDTNLLARMTNSGDRHCSSSRAAVQTLLARGERVIIVPKNFYEFWAVATRRPGPPPAGQNGLGMTPDQAGQWLGFFQRRFALLPDCEDLPARWHALVMRHGIVGYSSPMRVSPPRWSATASRACSRSTPTTSRDSRSPW